MNLSDISLLWKIWFCKKCNIIWNIYNFRPIFCFEPNIMLWKDIKMWFTIMPLKFKSSVVYKSIQKRKNCVTGFIVMFCCVLDRHEILFKLLLLLNVIWVERLSCSLFVARFSLLTFQYPFNGNSLVQLFHTYTEGLLCWSVPEWHCVVSL